ncbi:hypothetical protein [Microbispora hainanensis]|uniref:Uncharacterized protein n=1 Tax=Microbispora hainanensis TaxID=568844 RepID=A0A544YSL6_9ACTN|nr:hypothetical protein [Microbispora hainanensis]TQS19750.1 hypothetical protein FLX08_18295 [Microbispora hainanensis]
MLRQEIGAWLDDHESDPQFARFTAHFTILRRVLTRMLHALDAELDTAKTMLAPEAYERCRKLDRSLLTVRRIFTWYADKYDQRRLDRLGRLLRAADEVVRSCWTEPFAALGRAAPVGPLPYVDIRFDGMSTPRVSVPEDLRAPADGPAAKYIRQLPVPTIALPDCAVEEAWWLVIVAHETGHHVQKDLGLERATREAIRRIADEDDTRWTGWGLELFADAYSVLMVGSSARWAVEELQYGMTRPSARYPPWDVRVALIEAMDRGDGDPMADALLSIPVQGRPLREVTGERLSAQQIAAWATALTKPDPAVSRLSRRETARLIVSASVVAARHGDQAIVQENLVRILPECGPPGVLGPSLPPPEVDELAERLARELVG